MPLIPVLNTYVSGARLYASQLNADLSSIRTNVNAYAMFIDVAATVTVSHAFNATQNFTPSAGVAINVVQGGVAIVGNSTLTGTLGGLTGLTVASGGISVQAGGIAIAAGGLTVTAGNLSMGGGQAVAKRVDAGDTGTALTLNLNNGNIQRFRLTGNCTLTLNNPATGASYVIEALQDPTGSRSITWPAAVVWDNGVTPSLTTTAGRKDVFVLFYNGAKYLATTMAMNLNDTT